MDDAFIQSLQITQGREGALLLPPLGLLFVFYAAFSLPRNFFSQRRIFHRRKKPSVGKWLTGGTNFSMWNKSRFGRRRRVPWDKNGIPSDVRSRSDMGRVDVQKMSNLSALVFKFEVVEADDVTVLNAHLLKAGKEAALAQHLVEIHPALVVGEVDVRH